MSKQDEIDIFGYIRIIIPLVIGGALVIFLLFPTTFESATKGVKDILPTKKTPPELGMLTWEELEQIKPFNSLSEALKTPDEVRVLNMKSQRINEIPAEIAQLKKLQILELQSNQIEYIAKEIGQLPYLQYLYLGKNRITTLPAEIGNMRYLRHLDLNGNRIRMLPDEVGLLTTMEELDLRSNQLLSLNPQIKNLRSLRILRLRGNRLTKIPEELTQLDSLSYLDLSGNRNLNIRETFLLLAKCSNLKELDMSDLRMQIIPKVIAELRKLKLLILRGNSLSQTEKQNARNLLPNTTIEF